MAATPAEKPPPLLTRQGWELAAPVTASSVATAGALFGPAGLVAAGGAAAAAAGASALRNRTSRDPAKKTAAAERKAAAATMRQLARIARQVKAAERKATRAAGTPNRMPGLPQLGRRARAGSPAGGRRAGGAAGGARRVAGSVGRALGQLRGAAGRVAVPRSARSAGASPRGTRTPTGSKRSPAAAGSRRSAAWKPGGGLLGRLRSGGPGGRVPGGGSSPNGRSRKKQNRDQSPKARERARTNAAMARIRRALGLSGGRSAKRENSAGGKSGASGGGKPSLARRAVRRMLGRKPVSLVKKRKRQVPSWVGRILGRKPRRKTAAEKPPEKGSPVARAAIDEALDKTTATGRRPATPGAPSAAPTTTSPLSALTSTGSGSAMPGNPFAAVIEACGQAAHGYSPENALRVIEWYDNMPALIEAIADMLRHQGGKTVEEFFLYPQAGEFAQALGTLFLNYKDPCEQARHAFHAFHKDDLDKLRNPGRNQWKWDLLVNDADKQA